MSQAEPASLRRTLAKLGLIMAPGYALLLLNFALPTVPLDSTLALAAYWIAESGGGHGLPFLAVGLTLLLSLRPGLAPRRRLAEAGVIAAVTLLVLGGGAYANERVLKPALLTPRPNIVLLWKRGTLALSPDKFYKLGPKAKRSAYLARRLRHIERSGLAIDQRIKAHWISETGYSFPSGHSFASMCTATLFIGLALMLASGRYRWPFYLLLPWALAVCTSRPLLRVHSPTDISVGALEGIVCGSIGLLVIWAILVRRRVISSSA